MAQGEMLAASRRPALRKRGSDHTASWGGDWPKTINTLVLSEKDGRTTISQTVLYPSTAARDAALETGMKDGVSVSMDRLDKYLRTMA